MLGIADISQRRPAIRYASVAAVAQLTGRRSLVWLAYPLQPGTRSVDTVLAIHPAEGVA